MNELRIEVIGLPAPQGSKRAFRNKHTGRIHMAESSAKVKPWRQDVALAANGAIELASPDGWELWTGPILMDVTFRLPRPKGHYRTGRNAGLLRDSAPVRPMGKPDLSKLVRSTEDALTNVVWRDDAQLVGLTTSKFYVSGVQRPGATIWVWTWPGTVGEADG